MIRQPRSEADLIGQFRVLVRLDSPPQVMWDWLNDLLPEERDILNLWAEHTNELAQALMDTWAAVGVSLIEALRAGIKDSSGKELSP